MTLEVLYQILKHTHQFISILTRSHKVSGDNLCAMDSDLNNRQTISLRYFCVCYEKKPLKEEYIPFIGQFFHRRKEGDPMAIVLDVQQIRDFTHVNDVAAVKSLVTTKDLVESGRVYNFGSGQSLSILKIAKLILTNITFIPSRSGEARASRANTHKMKSHNNWVPKKNQGQYIAKKNFGNVIRSFILMGLFLIILILRFRYI